MFVTHVCHHTPPIIAHRVRVRWVEGGGVMCVGVRGGRDHAFASLPRLLMRYERYMRRHCYALSCRCHDIPSRSMLPPLLLADAMLRVIRHAYDVLLIFYAAMMLRRRTLHAAC